MAGPPNPPSLQKSTSSKSQKSILGFFQKKPAGTLQPQVNGVPSSTSPAAITTTLPIGSPKKRDTQKLVHKAPARVSQHLTPAPSSDAIEDDDEDQTVQPARKRKMNNSLPSPVTPGNVEAGVVDLGSSPSRKVRAPKSWLKCSADKVVPG